MTMRLTTGVILTLAVVTSNWSIAGSNDVSGRSDVVARVWGQVILDKDIRPDASLIPLLAKEHPDPKELEAVVHGFMKKELARRIARMIQDREINRQGIRVSSEEIDKEVETRFEKAGVSEDAAQAIRRRASGLAAAIKEWQEGADSEKVYAERVAELGVSKEAWEGWKAAYNTPEKLKALVAQIPPDLQSMKKNSRASTAQDLRCRKLENVLTQNVNVNDDEVRNQYRKEFEAREPFQRPAKAQVKDQLTQEVLRQKKASALAKWWLAQLDSPEIKIVDESFKSVPDEMKAQYRRIERRISNETK